MQHGTYYANDQPRSKVIVDKINQVRLWKRSILPCDLVGLEGTKTNNCGERDDEQSILKWKFRVTKLEKPNRSCCRK